MSSYKFSTNFEELARRLADALKTRDEEMVLETYEAIARYHSKKELPRKPLEAIAGLAYSKHQYMLAERALAHLTGPPAEFAESVSKCPENCFAAVKLSYLLTRKLYKPQLAKLYLETALKHLEHSVKPEQYSEYANLFPLEDPLAAARNEREYISKLYEYRSPPDNPTDDLQTVALFGMQTLSSYRLAEDLAKRTGVHKYEFSRRINTRTGLILRSISGNDNAKVVSQMLDELDMPSFVVADKLVDALVPESRPVKQLGVRDEGIYMQMNYRDNVTIPWDDVVLFDGCKLRHTEQKKEKPRRIRKYHYGGPGVSAGIIPQTPKTKIVESQLDYITVVSKNPFVLNVFNAHEGAILKKLTYDGEYRGPKSKPEWFAETVIQKCNPIVGYGGHQLAYDGFAGDWRNLTYKSADEYLDHLAWLFLVNKYPDNGNS